MQRYFSYFFLVTSLAMAVDSNAQGLTPIESRDRMKMAEGFQAELVASEPLVRQPVAIEYDDRGRLWVIQYLQYPNPAGLNRKIVDRYSRTEYDRVPPPPPRGPRGADRVTILEDVDGDGRADGAKDFIDGLNLASGLAFGHGGVFILQVPYLLFYPDANGDDIPDRDPDVLLTGFGMQDAHSVANSLTWGPDGWLYGCQGSTCTSRVRGIEFQQGVWRYHPGQRRFELFCEGGGNSWGLDFDRAGRLLYSTNLGGQVMLHGEQGGYYWKSFGKHGNLHNPHAYGHIEHVLHEDFRGGHVTVGGLIYQGAFYPPSFEGKYIAGDLLGHAVRWHHIEEKGSTFASKDGGELMLAQDSWFAPSDVTVGPDGCIVVCDWHDQRTAHPDPDADWDRTNGRIYRIAPKGKLRSVIEPLTSMNDESLMKSLDHPNDWVARRARRILAERNNDKVMARLCEELTLSVKEDRAKLQRLWTLMSARRLTSVVIATLMEDSCEHIRRWAIRALGDDFPANSNFAGPEDRPEHRELEPELRNALVARATEDKSLTILSQLAQSCQRWDSESSLEILHSLERRDESRTDPHLPNFIWWGIESKAITSQDDVVRRYASAESFSTPLVREFLLGRLVRRYASEASDKGDSAVLALLQAAPSDRDRATLFADLETGLGSRSFIPPTPNLVDIAAIIAHHPASTPINLDHVALGLRFDNSQAQSQALAIVGNQNEPPERRIRVLADLSRHQPDLIAELFLSLFETSPEEIQVGLIQASRRISTDAMAMELLHRYPTANATVKSSLRSALSSHELWSKLLLDQVESGAILATDFSPGEIAVLANHEPLRVAIEQIWGRVTPPTSEEKLAVIRRFNNDLRAAEGDRASGRVIFQKRCASCHALFGEGEKVGPDLTTANRADRDYLLVSLVDPSAMVRKEYVSHVIRLNDGQVIEGCIVSQQGGVWTVVDSKAERIQIRESDVDESTESNKSLMPEGLLHSMTPSDLRDLFAHLQASAPGAQTQN